MTLSAINLAIEGMKNDIEIFEAIVSDNEQYIKKKSVSDESKRIVKNRNSAYALVLTRLKATLLRVETQRGFELDNSG